MRNEVALVTCALVCIASITGAGIVQLVRGKPMQIEVRAFPVPLPQPGGMVPAVEVPLGAKVSHLEVVDGFHGAKLYALVDPTIDALETIRIIYLAVGVQGTVDAEWSKLEPLRVEPTVPGWAAVLQRE